MLINIFNSITFVCTVICWIHS